MAADRGGYLAVLGGGCVLLCYWLQSVKAQAYP
jgi:hypothetical protein